MNKITITQEQFLAFEHPYTEHEKYYTEQELLAQSGMGYYANGDWDL